jgi:hypothetical protein
MNSPRSRAPTFESEWTSQCTTRTNIPAINLNHRASVNLWDPWISTIRSQDSESRSQYASPQIENSQGGSCRGSLGPTTERKILTPEPELTWGSQSTPTVRATWTESRTQFEVPYVLSSTFRSRCHNNKIMVWGTNHSKLSVYSIYSGFV